MFHFDLTLGGHWMTWESWKPWPQEMWHNQMITSRSCPKASLPEDQDCKPGTVEFKIQNYTCI